MICYEMMTEDTITYGLSAAGEAAAFRQHLAQAGEEPCTARALGKFGCPMHYAWSPFPVSLSVCTWPKD